MRMNVRCCCDPNIVIGTLEAPPGNYTFIRIAPRLTVKGDILYPHGSGPARLEVGEVRVGGYTERAIKSEDRPDEFWDTLAGFRRGDRV